MILGDIVRVNKAGNKVDFTFEKNRATVEFITDDIVRFFIKNQKGAAVAEKVVSTLNQEVAIEVIQNDKEVELKTAALTVKVTKSFKIAIYNTEGLLLCRDYIGNRTETLGLDCESKALLKKEGQDEGTTKKTFKIEVVKQMEQDECFYGLGDKTGFLNKRGYEYEMWNSDDPSPHVESFKKLYKTIPFLITLREQCTFGLFFNNSFKSYYDLGKENRDYYYFAADEGNLDYYFIYGKDMKQVIKNYTMLTGRTKRPPMWSLGYHQSRWGYQTQEEILHIAKQFRKLDIPCDTIHLDIPYMEGCRVFTWNKEKFKSPTTLAKKLAEDGFHIVPIIDPGVKVEEGNSIYEEGYKNNYFATTQAGDIYTNEVWPGEVAYPDFLSNKVRNWWGKQHEDLFKLGITGIWNDMNEPASFNGEIPDDIIFNKEEGASQHKEIHNIYGHFMAKATYEGIKIQTQKRPFVLTRACYSGTQQYAAVWTGDNHSLWAHLQMSIPQLCNLGLSGFSFAGADVGGYGSDTTSELLVRWFQVGCFYPFFRNHNTLSARAQEPWMFDETTKAIIKCYIELRYQLLPYIYDGFVKGEETGLPIMQPLVLQYEADEKVKSLNDQFMLGDCLLVAPIVEQGKNYRAIYLPKGNWIDYWTGEQIEGEQVILREAPLEICPMYIKAGSLIPMYKVMQHVSKMPIEELIVNVYPGEGQYIHYQDNGEDFAYEKGEYNRYKLSVKDNIFKMMLTYKGYEHTYKKICVKYKDKQYHVQLSTNYIEIAL